MAIQVIADTSDWAHGNEDQVGTRIESTKVTEVQFSYDGGRVQVLVNGEKVYYNLSHSHDVTVTLKFED